MALRRQTGAFRVSCMDSLDRTNVAQTMVAMEMLRALCSVSDTQSLVEKPPWANRWLLAGVLRTELDWPLACVTGGAAGCAD